MVSDGGVGEIVFPHLRGVRSRSGEGEGCDECAVDSNTILHYT